MLQCHGQMVLTFKPVIIIATALALSECAAPPLWGDYPLEAWIAPDTMSPPYSTEAREMLRAWKAKAFFISRDVFSIVWALALGAVGAWGAMHGRRGAVNMAATFAGIHFYTQWFERLRATPEMVIAAGVIAVAFAFGLGGTINDKVRRQRCEPCPRSSKSYAEAAKSF
jgi:hypothetical protein